MYVYIYIYICLYIGAVSSSSFTVFMLVSLHVRFVSVEVACLGRTAPTNKYRMLERRRFCTLLEHDPGCI